MDVLTDDHEREEAVRKWWREYWKPIVLGIAIAIAGLLGFRQYQAYQLEQSQQSAYAMFQIQSKLLKSGMAAIEEAQTFINENKDIYGSLLSLDVAAMYIATNQYDKAIENINFAQEHGGELLSSNIALTKARLFAQNDKYDDALKIAQELIDKKVFVANAYEIKGDILLKQGKKDLAHDAYKAAIDTLVADKKALSPLLQMKFDSLIQKGETPAYKVMMTK